jgi:hypothetical protein
MPTPDVAPSPASSAPAPAMLAGVLGIAGALPVLYLGMLVWALGGLSSDGSGRSWALLPLVAAATQLAGGVRLLRRRDWRLLVAGCVPVAVFVAGVLARSLAVGEIPPVGTLLLAGPVLALVLALTPRARQWVAGRAGGGADATQGT